MTNRMKFSVILGLISILLEIASVYYGSDTILDAACYICFSIFIFSCGDWDLKEEHRDIDVPMSKDIENSEKDNGLCLVELMLLQKIERFTPEFLESKSIRFLEAQKYDLSYYLKVYRPSLHKEVVAKLEATIDLIIDTHRVYKARLNGRVFDTRILFKKDVSQMPLISLIEIRNALKWSLEFVKYSDKGRSTAENRLNEVEGQLQKAYPKYFNHMKLQDGFNK
jgi:hypothetical protein